MDTIETRMLPASAGDDPALTSHIADLVNLVYIDSDKGLRPDDINRTSPTEIAEIIHAGDLAVAYLSSSIIGCAHMKRVNPSKTSLNMLVADPSHRGIGLGRALAGFVEDETLRRGARVISVDLMVPDEGTHPVKKFLGEWYERMGYRIVRTQTAEEMYPNLAKLLSTPCHFIVYEKRLDD